MPGVRSHPRTPATSLELHDYAVMIGGASRCTRGAKIPSSRHFGWRTGSPWVLARPSRPSAQTRTPSPASTRMGCPPSDGRRERAGKAQLVTVPVADVEVALAPRCVRRGGFRSEPSRKGVSIQRIDVIDPEHDSAPDGPPESAGGVVFKIEVAGAHTKARETGVLASIEQLKAERLVERHGLRHVRRE